MAGISKGGLAQNAKTPRAEARGDLGKRADPVLRLIGTPSHQASIERNPSVVLLTPAPPTSLQPTASHWGHVRPVVHRPGLLDYNIACAARAPSLQTKVERPRAQSETMHDAEDVERLGRVRRERLDTADDGRGLVLQELHLSGGCCVHAHQYPEQ